MTVSFPPELIAVQAGGDGVDTGGDCGGTDGGDHGCFRWLGCGSGTQKKTVQTVWTVFWGSVVRLLGRNPFPGASSRAVGSGSGDYGHGSDTGRKDGNWIGTAGVLHGRMCDSGEKKNADPKPGPRCVVSA
jgi:hypothetical protein